MNTPDLPALPPLPRPDIYDPGRFGFGWRETTIYAYAQTYARECIAARDIEIARLSAKLNQLREQAEVARAEYKVISPDAVLSMVSAALAAQQPAQKL
jgi:hypothetical protein